MRITLPSGTTAELVRPDGDIARGVAVCPDIAGLRPLFDRLAADLAAAYGWSVCVIEPFPTRERSTVEERLSGLCAELDDTAVLDDLEAAAAATGATRTAALGFCMGGMYALKAAARPVFDRTVSFYGMIHVPEDWRGPGQREPLAALAERDATDVLAIVGGLDAWTPPDHVAELRDAGVNVVSYPEAEHGFAHDPERPSHRLDDARDAFLRVARFLS